MSQSEKDESPKPKLKDLKGDFPSRRFKWQQFDDNEIKNIFDRHFDARGVIYNRSQMEYHLNLLEQEGKCNE